MHKVVKLIKCNRKTTDVVVLEIDGVFIRKKEGKLSKPFSFSSTIKCESEGIVQHELAKIVDKYKEKGYSQTVGDTTMAEFEVFDKAKWHIHGDFPTDLDQRQAFIHTGFYVGWLIANDLVSDEMKKNSEKHIGAFLSKKISAVDFYESQLDGVFTSGDVNDEGYGFTKDYFVFEYGEYLKDYELVLARHLPSIYHVQDTDENFEKISRILDQRYNQFKTNVNQYA